MTERKIINKHKNIEFLDRKNLIIKKKKLKKIHFMTPFDLTCLNCNQIIFKGKKLNAIKEKISIENYLGIQIFRFYFKCSNCFKGISIKTDPKNSSYCSEINCKINKIFI
jgi:hypothetical protein